MNLKRNTIIVENDNQLSSSQLIEDNKSNSEGVSEELNDSVELNNLNGSQYQKDLINFNESTDMLSTMNQQLMIEEQKQLLIDQIDEQKNMNLQLVSDIKELQKEMQEYIETNKLKVKEITILQEKNDQMNTLCNQNIYEINALKQQLHEYEFEIYEKEEINNELKEQLLKCENDKINIESTLKNQKNCINQLKTQIYNLQFNGSNITLDQIKDQIQNDEIIRLKQDNDHFQIEINQNQQIFQQNQEKLQMKIKEFIEQINTLKEQLIIQQEQEQTISLLNKQIIQLQEKNKDINQENCILNEKLNISNQKLIIQQQKQTNQKINYNKLKQEYGELILQGQQEKHLHQQQKQQFNQMKKELGKFKYQRDSLIEVQSKLLKSQLIEDDQNYKKQYDMKQLEFIQIQNELNTQKEEILQDKQQIIALKNQIEKFENIISEMQKSNEILKIDNFDQSQYILQQKQTNNSLAIELQKYQEENNIQKKRMEQYDIESSKIISQLNQQIQESQSFSQKQVEDYDQLEQQIQQFKIELQEKEYEIQNNKNQFKQIKEQMSEEIKKNNVLIEQLQGNILKLMKVKEIKNKYQQTEINCINQSSQTDEQLNENIIINNQKDEINIEGTINYIMNNIENMNTKLNLNQYNITELLHFKQIIEHQLEINQQPNKLQHFEIEQQLISTSVITPRSSEKKQLTQINQSTQFNFESIEIQTLNINIQNLQNQILQYQIQLQEQQQNIQQLTKKIENYEFKKAEQNFLTIISDSSKSDMQKDISQPIQLISQINNLEQMNLELRIKLEASSEIAKENIKLRKKIANLENYQEYQSRGQSFSPTKIINPSLILMKFQQKKSSDKKKSGIQETYTQSAIKQNIIEGDLYQMKKQAYIMKQQINEYNSKLTYEKELTKSIVILLNTLSQDLKKKINQLNNEENTKKKQIINFLEKIILTVEFIIKKQNQKNKDNDSTYQSLK